MTDDRSSGNMMMPIMVIIAIAVAVGGWYYTRLPTQQVAPRLNQSIRTAVTGG